MSKIYKKITTPAGNVIEIQSEIKGDNNIVSIKDNGVGLTKKKQEHMLQAFVKIEIQSEVKGDNIIVSIKDNGVGLMKEE